MADLAKAQAKLTTFQADLEGEPERLAAALAAQKTQLDEQYRLDRAALKASGDATQQDYQQLKTTHATAVADLAKAQAKLTEAKTEADKVPALVAQLNAAQEQTTTVTQQSVGLARQVAQYQRDGATATTAQADKVLELEQQLKTTQQEAINTKLTADERYKKLHGQALEIQSERNELAKKVATLSVAPPAQPERRPTPAAPAQIPAPRHQTPAVQAPAPAPAPTLAERLAESLQRLLDWIKGQGGVLKEINTEKADCDGAVVQLDDLHAVQRVGRGTYAIYQLDKLDKVPTLDDPKTEISYRGGRGTVVGQGYGHGLGR